MTLITGGCACCASSATSGAAWIADGSQRSFGLAGSWDCRCLRLPESWSFFVENLRLDGGTYTLTTRSGSSCDQIFGSNWTIFVHGAITVTT